MSNVIVLFDIDGTLLTFEGAAPGPGRTAMDEAMRRCFAIEGASDGVRFAGGTDRGLARALLTRAGLGDDDIVVHAPRLLDAYLVALEAELTRRKYKPIGDVVAAVAACRSRGWCVGLGTGNMRAGAALKLGSAGLVDAFNLDHGGYGCDAEVRAELVGIGIARCRAALGDAHAHVVVVGDTRHDVEAARQNGAYAIGVASFDGARAELEAAGADAIVADCGMAVVDAIAAIFKAH